MSNIRVLLMIAVFLAASVAISEESMRCGSRVVAGGDPKGRVVKLCGQPTQTETRTVFRSGLPRHSVRNIEDSTRSISDRELVIHDRSLIEVKVDVWVYNRGRSRLMREIVFEDNRVTEVNILGRGY